MDTPNRFAVPLTELDRVRVRAAEQLQEQSAPRPQDDTSLWGGALTPAHGGGGGAPDADGE